MFYSRSNSGLLVPSAMRGGRLGGPIIRGRNPLTGYHHRPTQAFRENDLDVYVPELWARESMAILLEEMVMANLVHRDFEEEFAQYGETINISRPGGFEAKRKHLTDNITIQDAVADKIQVKLDQHIHVSFIIRDGEESKGFTSLVDEFLQPALEAQARFIDRVVIGQYVHFLVNGVGELGNLTAANSVGYLLALRQRMSQNKAPMTPRIMALTPGSETALLSNELFLDASRVGDEGTALREASLGRKLGFDMFSALNAPTISSGNTTSAGAINNGAGYGIGTTVLTVDGITGAIAVGTWLTIAGEMYPHRVSAKTDTLGNTTSITLETGLKKAVADDAVITFYTPGAVNNAAGYAAGWAKEITIDGFTVAPQVGQIVTFGTNLAHGKYTIVDTNGLVGITLDRPLAEALVDDQSVNIGPAGSYNLAFHRDAIALVVRPLALPRPSKGVEAGVENFGGLSIRVVISYDAERQGSLVTVDMLAGIAVLDDDLGGVLLG